ncbi:hypothetical protein PCO31110_04034 [Pandoraea communis]|uniref:Integrase n=1 Tax=Pandoraea communis TaxID=2508297 RepID=A0A5E4XMZ5_9BURK|nr:hypothetical protein PCO31110_04034 [Pandoraea communis]
MSVKLFELTFKITDSVATPDHVYYRPPHWPPPADWIVSEDVHGNPLSSWGGPVWDFSASAGKNFKLDFAGGRHGRSAPPLNPENQHLLRLWTTWIIWGPRSSQGWASLKSRFNLLRRIVVLCDQEGILATSLARYPKLLERVPGLYSVSSERQRILATLDRLHQAEAQIGHAPVDEWALAFLSKAFADANSNDADEEQTAYIPPRIWIYQLSRLRQCLDDFLDHRQRIEDCFNFCVDAYANNFGSLEAALIRKAKRNNFLPFTVQQNKRAGIRNGRKFHGRFELTARRFGIDVLIKKWISPHQANGFDIRSFTKYMTLVQSAGLAYIANFTLQRREEVGSLRADCLTWDFDEVFGRIAVICGETTKTDPDSDARWPTSPNVEVAVEAMTVIARLRMRCAAVNPEVHCSEEDRANPYLSHIAFEPWSSVQPGWKPYSTLPPVPSYQSVMRRYPHLFDAEVLRITEDDLTTARKFTPNLDKGGKFKVGEIWPLALHMLRRTGAINMFASGLVCESSIQVMMKHATPIQTRYYGKHYSRARFSADYEEQTVAARYEVMARQMEAFVEDRYVPASGEQRKQEIAVSLIGLKDFNSLLRACRKGEVSFRETRLGGCTKRGHCEYGGIESISRCAGGDGGKPCGEAIYDRKKRSSVERQLESVERKIAEAQPFSPRERALQSEAQGLRNYLNVIHN